MPFWRGWFNGAISAGEKGRREMNGCGAWAGWDEELHGGWGLGMGLRVAFLEVIFGVQIELGKAGMIVNVHADNVYDVTSALLENDIFRIILSTSELEDQLDMSKVPNH
ncbi:hypothetical protein P154DRAFT_531808 [Amniculicola lignicola CBS 123094]|uniref:Uncharacterized protein n=1 Tax=Amniculicola lignicola CBS 123094 TaxID=1392246 RepID=A0A6A5WQZ7_9PLEO|nr:hypothetical protein P154DRAFT_531808 [Amniculicola lignicola CBS 123094]